jgi:two-component system OmpR family response regulator
LKPEPSILYVDDHEDTRVLIMTWLGGMGYEVVPADCARQALILAKARKFDLYLLDSRLVDGSGIELCEKLREFDKTTPVIFYSGDHPARMKEALECDVQGYVMKPGFDALPKALGRALNVV